MVVVANCAWATWPEWRNVYYQLTSADAAERVLGVRRVNAWRSRGRLPVAVEIVGSLVEVMLNDPHFNCATLTPRSENELRLVYSMLVVRAINGIVDKVQKAKTAVSINMLAEKLSWPHWLVDLRHQATHSELPALPTLRLAAQETMWQLLERFWVRQLKMLKLKDSDHSNPDLQANKFEKAWAKSIDIALHQKTPQENLARAIKKIIKLAFDETLIIDWLVSSMAAHNPETSPDIACAVCALCEHSSDNFALRLARHLAEKALGGGLVELQSTAALSGSVAGLQSICDSCADTGIKGPTTLAKGVVEEDASDDTAMRMIKWLHALLSTSSAERGGSCVRFSRVLTDFVPLLRRAVLQRLAKLPQPEADKLATQAIVFWEMLGHVDSGSAYFILFCSNHVKSQSTKSCNTLSGEPSKIEVSVHDSLATMELKDVEELVRTRKRRKVSRKVNKPKSEPWTAVGTTLDVERLAVQCPSEENMLKCQLTEEVNEYQKLVAHLSLADPEEHDVSPPEKESDVAPISVAAGTLEECRCLAAATVSDLHPFPM